MPSRPARPAPAAAPLPCAAFHVLACVRSGAAHERATDTGRRVACTACEIAAQRVGKVRPCIGVRAARRAASHAWPAFLLLLFGRRRLNC